jgi:hypothetical protein
MRKFALELSNYRLALQFIGRDRDTSYPVPPAQIPGSSAKGLWGQPVTYDLMRLLPHSTEFPSNLACHDLFTDPVTHSVLPFS